MKHLLFILLLAIPLEGIAQKAQRLRIDTDVAIILYYKGYENGDTVKMTKNIKSQFGFFPAGKVKVKAEMLNNKLSKNTTRYKITTYEGNEEVILLKGTLADLDKKDVTFELKEEGSFTIYLE